MHGQQIAPEAQAVLSIGSINCVEAAAAGIFQDAQSTHAVGLGRLQNTALSYKQWIAYFYSSVCTVVCAELHWRVSL